MTITNAILVKLPCIYLVNDERVEHRRSPSWRAVQPKAHQTPGRQGPEKPGGGWETLGTSVTGDLPSGNLLHSY